MYFKPPVENQNFWNKKNLRTRRKVNRPLWGYVTFLRMRKEKILKKFAALAGGYLTLVALLMAGM